MTVMNNGTIGTSLKVKHNSIIKKAVEKSNITIMFLLFTLSARIPPIIERTTIGIKETAVAIPKIVDEFFCRNKYNGKANLNIAFPNSEII